MPLGTAGPWGLRLRRRRRRRPRVLALEEAQGAPHHPVARDREGGGDEEAAERAPRGGPLHVRGLLPDARSDVASGPFLLWVLRELLFRRVCWVPWARPWAWAQALPCRPRPPCVAAPSVSSFRSSAGVDVWERFHGRAGRGCWRAEGRIAMRCRASRVMPGGGLAVAGGPIVRPCAASSALAPVFLRVVPRRVTRRGAIRHPRTVGGGCGTLAGPRGVGPFISIAGDSQRPWRPWCGALPPRLALLLLFSLPLLKLQQQLRGFTGFVPRRSRRGSVVEEHPRLV